MGVYKKFSEQFGKRWKLGVHEDPTSSISMSEGVQISLKEYCDRMKDIHYGTGVCVDDGSLSPSLVALRMKGPVVHYMADPNDEYSVQQPQWNHMKSTNKGGVI